MKGTNHFLTENGGLFVCFFLIVMRLGTNHFHSDGGRGWDFTVSEIFFPQARN
jgi:hypothetical protein